MGQALRIAGDPVRAGAYWEESLAAHRAFGVRGRGLAACLCHLAGLAVDDGELAAAGPLVEEALGIGCEMGDVYSIARALEVTAALAAAVGTVGEAERALRLAGAAAALREASGVPLTWYQDEEVQRWLAPARDLLGEHASAAWTAGQELSPDQAIAEALASAD